MIGDGFDPRLWTMGLIGLVVALGVLRLMMWQRSAPLAARSPKTRLALLVGLNLGCGLLLYLSLFPPNDTVRSGALIVATAGTKMPPELRPGDVLVALPEADAIAGAVRTPDLATALRRFPDASGIRILGQGLVPRDRDEAPDGLNFDPPAAPRGLIDIALPDPVVPGASFSVGGQIGTLPRGSIELVDPGENIVDRVDVAAGRRFVVTADARTPGLALFTLRLRDQAGGIVEQMAVPIQTRDEVQPRIYVLAGAPEAETKFLRRWAGDAGIDLTVDIDVGAGVQLGDGRLALTRASLAEVDLVVMDDRRWEGLSAADRATLTAAVSDGLGLLLRPTGPLSPTSRRQWAALGLPLTGTDEIVATLLDPPPQTGNQDDRSRARAPVPPPELARRDLVDPGTGAVSVIRDADDTAVASWRSRGQGRVGVWTVTDSYALVLTGREQRYADLWSDLFSALARPGENSLIRVEGVALTGRRTGICRIAAGATVVAPDGRQTTVQVDPRTGQHACGAFWPDQEGWHLVRGEQGREALIFVQSPAKVPSLVAWADRQATLALVDPSGAGSDSLRSKSSPGSPWPWFLSLLAAWTWLWWLERRRRKTAT